MTVILLKEVIDIFAKSCAEYIHPQALDALGDLLLGLLGLLAVWFVIRWRSGSAEGGVVGAKGISCRVGEAIFGRDAIKSIPR